MEMDGWMSYLVSSLDSNSISPIVVVTSISSGGNNLVQCKMCNYGYGDSDNCSTVQVCTCKINSTCISQTMFIKVHMECLNHSMFLHLDWVMFLWWLIGWL